MRHLCGAALIAAIMTSAASAETDGDRIRKILVPAIASCWSMPPQTDQTLGIFSIRFKLKPDGSVDGKPEPVKEPASDFERGMANSGIRAILKCSPYDGLPASDLPYADWQDIIVSFDPADFAL